MPKDKTFSEKDLIRLYCRNLTAIEQKRFRKLFFVVNICDGHEVETYDSFFCETLKDLFGDLSLLLGLLLTIRKLLGARLRFLAKLLDRIAILIADIPVVGKLVAGLLVSVSVAIRGLNSISGELDVVIMKLEKTLNRLSALMVLECMHLFGD